MAIELEASFSVRGEPVEPPWTVRSFDKFSAAAESEDIHLKESERTNEA